MTTACPWLPKSTLRCECSRGRSTSDLLERPALAPVAHGDPAPDPCRRVSRLVDLAPQYYLGNLPPSEGKEQLMALRRSQEPQPVGAAEAAAAAAACQPPAERCLLQ